jgi:hypothetical protein
MGEENAVDTTSLKMAPDNTLVIRVLIFKPGNQPSADQQKTPREKSRDVFLMGR